MATKTKITVKQYGPAFIDNYSAVDPLVSRVATDRSSTHAIVQLTGSTRYEVFGTNLKFDLNHKLLSGKITQIKYEAIHAGSSTYHVDLVASGFSLDVGKARTAYIQHESYGLATDPVWVFTAINTPAGPGGVGVETFYGDRYADQIKGSNFNDDLDGHEGNDNIQGLNGNDMLGGGAGNDTVYGGAGNDTLSGSSGNDTLNGGDGRDWYMAPHSSYFQSTSPLKVDLSAGTASSTAWGADRLVAIENVYGSYGNDTIAGSSANNTFLGYGGNDRINGRAGNDRMLMSAGVDTLTGGTGKDSFVFASAPGSSTGHITDFKSGEDTLVIGWNPSGGYGVGDTLDVNEIAFGAQASTSTQRLVYNKANGGLYFDADGAGGAPQVLIGILDNKPTLTFNDFKLVHLDGFWV